MRRMQSLNMLVCTEGKERNLAQYEVLLRQPGSAVWRAKKPARLWMPSWDGSSEVGLRRLPEPHKAPLFGYVHIDDALWRPHPVVFLAAFDFAVGSLVNF